MSKAIRIVSAFAVLLIALPLAAQEQPAPGLKKNGSAYVHEMSKSNFTLPEGWRVEPTDPQLSGQQTLLGVRHGPPPGQSEPTIDVTVSWTPLVIKMDEAVAQENLAVGQIYGVDKVTKAEGVTRADSKPGYKIKVDNGPTRNGKEIGVIYLFEAGPDEKSRWKIRVRATVSKLHQEEHLKMVDALVQNIKW